MEPASSIIARLGGEKIVSEITGKAYTAPYRWQHAVAKGGTGGLIPQKHHRALLDFAAANGIALTPADFLPTSDKPHSTPASAGKPRADSTAGASA